ncbi:MAG: response regulator [bacterium]|nr:response regulator [bacterium]
MKSLVIEDDLGSRLLLERILMRYGPCTCVTNAFEGIQRFKEALEQQEPFEVVVIDIVLPGRDGFEVLAQIRNDERRRHVEAKDRTHLILATALTDTKYVLKGFQEGTDLYLTKPFGPPEVRGFLKELGYHPEEL